MRPKTIAAEIMLVGALAGCASAPEQAPTTAPTPTVAPTETPAPEPTPTFEETPTPTPNIPTFLAKGKDSDKIVTVNCIESPKAVRTVALPDSKKPSYGVSVTLGSTEQATKNLPKSKVKFVGGATIYAFGNHEFILVSSGGEEPTPVEYKATENDPGFGFAFPVNEDYSLGISIANDSTATIRCLPSF